jgi:glycosyltransferase involved in cell wall biosynthesis
LLTDYEFNELNSMSGREHHASLNILHVLRAPVRGLFRHVVDLARGQSARGHRVGLVADSITGGRDAEATLSDLSADLALGVSRIPMSRHVSSADVAAVDHVTRRAATAAADVIHGHGAKGGAYARLAGTEGAIRVYTPHGGSLHYRWTSPLGFFYLAAERALMRRADLFLFESAYGREAFQANVGRPSALVRVVHNGVSKHDFDAVATAAEVTDLVFIGELRALKGVDVLIEAIALLAREGCAVTATIIGSGPDRAAFERQAAKLGLRDAVRFVGAKPARTGFALGRLVVVPSRAESLPYIVLEAAAAGMPLIATNVGGIPEVFGSDACDLVPPGDPAALAHAIGQAIRDPGTGRFAAQRLRARVAAAFSADAMTDAVLAAYAEAINERVDSFEGWVEARPAIRSPLAPQTRRNPS